VRCLVMNRHYLAAEQMVLVKVVANHDRKDDANTEQHEGECRAIRRCRRHRQLTWNNIREETNRQTRKRRNKQDGGAGKGTVFAAHMNRVQDVADRQSREYSESNQTPTGLMTSVPADTMIAAVTVVKTAVME
jgi:hypothetical protein